MLFLIKIVFKSYCIKTTFTAHQVHERIINKHAEHETVAHPRCTVNASPEFHSVSSWARGRSWLLSRGLPPCGSPRMCRRRVVVVCRCSRSRPVGERCPRCSSWSHSVGMVLGWAPDRWRFGRADPGTVVFWGGVCYEGLDAMGVGVGWQGTRGLPVGRHRRRGAAEPPRCVRSPSVLLDRESSDA